MKNHNQNKLQELISIAPSFFLVFFITAYVFINTFKESLGIIPELSLHGISWEHYTRLWGDKVFWQGFGFSLKIALLSTTLSLGAGAYLSYRFSRTREKREAFWYRYPIILSYAASAALIYNMYSPKGLVYRLLMVFNMGATDLDIIYASSGSGVIFLNLFKGIPFVAFSLYPIFVKVDAKYKETARNLGCKKSTYVYRILLPLCRHSMLTSFLVLFNYNLFAYEGFYFLGPSAPVSIGLMAYKAHTSADLSLRAYAMAISFVMMTVSLILCVIFYKSLKASKRGISL